jgi:uncharacterized protein
VSRLLRPDDPRAIAAVEAIRAGDIEELKRLLRNDQDLATAVIRDENGDDGVSRTLLHMATDWPGHFPDVATTIEVLVDAGAKVDARNAPGTETPLHWAASSDDIDALDALVAAGADIEAPGAVIAGGTPLDDAVAFGQWQAARRLAHHGARTAVWHAAALGLIDRVDAHFTGDPAPGAYPWGASGEETPDGVTVAFWCASWNGCDRTGEDLVVCHGDYCPPNALMIDGRGDGLCRCRGARCGRPVVGPRGGDPRGHRELRVRPRAPVPRRLRRPNRPAAPDVLPAPLRHRLLTTPAGPPPPITTTPRAAWRCPRLPVLEAGEQPARVAFESLQAVGALAEVHRSAIVFDGDGH